MAEYFHSVTLDKDKCKGCTNCIKRCPTEAIRVRDGKAQIIAERCIDCGECIRVCPYHAKQAITDEMNIISKYRYKIALPAPTLYGQFKDVKDIDIILNALKSIGFDDIFEVAKAAEIVSLATKEKLTSKSIKKPMISCACPAVVRLIRVRFPSLIDNILPIKSPMEVAGMMSKKIMSKALGLSPEDIGVFFISPCAAKVTDTKEPIGMEKSYIDGVISMREVSRKLMPVIKNIENPEPLSTASMQGIIWANSGGESEGLDNDKNIFVNGIHNVINILEEIENDNLSDIDFVEALACIGGCVGGPLTVENSFVAANRIKRLAKSRSPKPDYKTTNIKDLDMSWTTSITYMPIMKLDTDVSKAIKKMETMDNIYEGLPGLDCGSCGAPNCRALAEDIVRGLANETDCIFMLRQRVKSLTKEMLELDGKKPNVFLKKDDGSDKNDS